MGWSVTLRDCLAIPRGSIGRAERGTVAGARLSNYMQIEIEPFPLVARPLPAIWIRRSDRIHDLPKSTDHPVRLQQDLSKPLILKWGLTLEYGSGKSNIFNSGTIGIGRPPLQSRFG